MATLTPKQAATKTRALGKSFLSYILKPMNQSRKDATKRTREDFKKTQPGRSIFGRKRKGGVKGPPLIVKGRTARLSKTQGGFLAQITIEGMAAIIEKGEKTGRHRVKPRAKTMLKFTARGGETVYSGGVDHPGSKMPRREIGRRAIDKTFRTLPAKINESLRKGTIAAGLG